LNKKIISTFRVITPLKSSLYLPPDETQRFSIFKIYSRLFY